MRKYPRIEIDQKAYDGLQIEAVLRSKTVREIATNAILGYISKEALMVLDHKTYEDTKLDESPTPIKSRTRPAAQAQTWRPKQLAKDAAALSRIKELWLLGMTVADIARDLGRPRQTVEARVKDMIGRGELAERIESGAKPSGEV